MAMVTRRSFSLRTASSVCCFAYSCSMSAACPPTRLRKMGVLSQLPTVIKGSLPSHSGRGLDSCASLVIEMKKNRGSQTSRGCMTRTVYAGPSRHEPRHKVFCEGSGRRYTRFFLKAADKGPVTARLARQQPAACLFDTVRIGCEHCRLRLDPDASFGKVRFRLFKRGPQRFRGRASGDTPDIDEVARIQRFEKFFAPSPQLAAEVRRGERLDRVDHRRRGV